MAFTKALYYPWIDIENEAWLKNAMLYWEKIHTIVPSSIERPYSTKTAQEFYHEGLLLPFHVESSMRDIEELTDDVLKYLESPEGAEVLMSKEISEYHYIHPYKLSEEIRELMEIHPDKLPYEIRHRIERSGRTGDWISVDSRFADFYMTLLATHLSERIGAGLLTDITANNKLATAVRLDAKLSIPKGRRYRHDMPLSLAQGTLVDMIFERINIAPDTPVRKILEFRTSHADELGRFRSKIAELTETVSADMPLDALRQRAEDIYLNEVKPAISSLKKDLTDNKIRWGTENFLKVAFVSTGSTSIPLVLLGLAAPYALLASTGVSLFASAILYNREKTERLRQNPFSYVLTTEKSFHV